MDRYFSYVNESNWLGIGGNYLLHATTVQDLAKQLSFRVTRHIGEESIPVVDRTDDILYLNHIRKTNGIIKAIEKTSSN